MVIKSLRNFRHGSYSSVCQIQIVQLESKPSVSAKCYTVLICPRQLVSNKKGCITFSETEKKYVCLQRLILISLEQLAVNVMNFSEFPLVEIRIPSRILVNNRIRPFCTAQNSWFRVVFKMNQTKLSSNSIKFRPANAYEICFLRNNLENLNSKY